MPERWRSRETFLKELVFIIRIFLASSGESKVDQIDIVTCAISFEAFEVFPLHSKAAEADALPLTPLFSKLECMC